MMWMEKVKLSDICSPKQWKTIPTSDLLNEGYPVYGANGIIGYYNEYNHENPVVTVTCRGATCGSINITVPKAYVTGNAMCLDDLKNDIEIEYLYYCLKHYDFKNVIIGSAQPQITRQGMDKIYIMLCSREEQRDIVNKLKKTEKVIKLRKQELQLLDDLAKARFVEMFGDPETNSKGWAEISLSEKLNVLGGYAFKSDQFEETGGIPVLRIGNINSGYFKPVNMVYWKEDRSLERYAMYPGDLVMSLTGTVGKDDYGNVCILGNAYEMYYLNQRNAKLELKDGLDKYYLAELLKFSQVKKKLTGISRGVRQANISNKDILNLVAPIPPMELQQQFANFVEQIAKSKATVQKALDETQLLFDSLMQQYFG